jgi:uncharacterized protein YqhQ
MAENKAPKQFSYGGQAVIEGVMMRGAHKAAIAVRNPKGEIVIHEQPLNATLYRGRISRTPFLRGLVGLWDALGLGTRALMWSADVALDEGDKEDSKSVFDGPLGYGTLAVSLTIAVGIFFIQHLLGLDDHPFLVNLIEGIIQLAMLIGYIWLIGRLPDVKRLFGYHGAEHKTINAYEAGAELTPEVVAKYPIEHPRCGTAFLLMVAFVGVLVFSLLGRPPFALLLLSRIVLIPVIAGIAYEVIRFTAKNINNPLIRIIVKPNLALQHLTTREPDLTMIEVAIAAFQRVLVSESVLSEDQVRVPVPQTMSEQAVGD